MKTCQIPFARRKGTALIIILSFLVLLTGLVLAFFSRALTERQVSNSSAAQIKADLLARSAADVIVGDLKQEIAAGSAPTAAPTPVYLPTSNANIVPQQSGVPSPAPTPPIPNLVRRSVRDNGPSGANPMPSPGVPSRASAVNSTTDPSLNGRSVALARWNSHYLIPRHNTGTTIDCTPISPLNTTSPETYGFTPPDWVMVTTSGPQVLTTPDATVIGRYAYAIYDEGGLLDANVAGYPSSTTVAQSGSKGSLAFADLTQLPYPIPNDPNAQPSARQVDKIVGWRNYASVHPVGDLSGFSFDAGAATRYYNSVISNSTGFLSVNPQPSPSPATSASRTDQMFTSRQALLRFRRTTGFSQNALQYLGTFTRDLNRPNFVPLANPPVTRTLSPQQLTYSGDANNTNPGDKNPIVQSVFYTSSSATNNRQPVVSQRFPLSRLALFSDPVGNAAAIQQYFGLTRTVGSVKDGYTWNYNPTLSAGSATTINTLAQVGALAPVAPATATRAPNFFELLQAAVLEGSLATFTTNSPAETRWLYTSDMIIQMGVNLIDQYSSSGYPTVISFNAQTFAGIKNLPYLSEVLIWPYRPMSDPTRYTLNIYALIEVWNPHQNATDVSAAPQQLKVQLGFNGKGTYGGAVHTVTDPITGKPVSQTDPMVYFLTNDDNITFTNSNAFQEPTVLGTPGDNDNIGGPQLVTVQEGASSRSGFLVGTGQFPDQNLAKSMGDPLYASFIKYTASGWFGENAGGGTNGSVALYFMDASGTWHPYQGNNSATSIKSNRISPSVSQGEGKATMNVNSAFPPDNTPVSGDICFNTFNFIGGTSFQLSDPRTANGSHIFSAQSTYAKSVRPTTSGTYAYGAWCGRNLYGAFPDYSNPYSPSTSGYLPYAPCAGLLNENAKSTVYAAGIARNTWIADEDGVIRPGDGAYGANPFISGSSMSARPILLGRPFRSVGEMGYADRGYGAWKSINFFSQESGDAGLLDFFSIDPAPVSAGKINLNTRQAPVLQAMLQGAYRIEPRGSATPETLNSSDASALAQAIVAHTSAPAGSSSTYIAGPLVSRADLVRSLLGDPAITSAIGSIQGTSSNTLKSKREAFVRALADVGTTRTWNLLIDVVAQTGNYPPNATGLSQFVVQGEKHYWLHVALDRYTGEIVDSQMEAVNE